MGTAHHLHVIQPRRVTPASLLLVVPPLPLLPVRLPTNTAAAPPPAARQVPATDASPPRCSEKGCIFPPRTTTGGKCLYHWREENEPTMFVSRQPIRAVLDQVTFYCDIEPPPFGSRVADRQRWAKEREAFFNT